ncbi:MAG: EthD family reductase [Cyclobacteriaceae bacterium]|nr:EthD family reductase [Cyclobacteriaceae bacterium]
MKTTFGFLFIIFGLMCGCQQTKIDDSPKIKKGMIKMTILYPNGEDKTFDMDYYVNKHMTLAKTLLGDSVKIISIDKGLSGGRPDAPLPFLAVGYFYFETISALQNSMGPARDKLVADIPNFTNIQPIVQISEVQQ